MSSTVGTAPSVVPALLDAKTAAKLCGVSRSTFLGWDSAGLCPRRIKIGGRVLWSHAQLEKWASQGCPDRASMEATK